MRAARFLRSTTARMVLPIAVFQMLAAGGMLGFVWFAGQKELQHEHDALVSELHDDLMSDYREGGVGQVRQVIAERLRIEGQNAPILLLVDGQGRRIVGNLDVWPAARPDSMGRLNLALRRSTSPAAEPMALRVETLGGGYRLATGWETGGDVRLKRSYEQALLVALLLAIPLALLVALLASRSIALRIHDLAETAHHVGSGELDARVPLNGSGDSFDELAGRINQMLDRIESLVGELRLVTDGLAHDLRSPVTRLKSVIERASAETSDPQAFAALERAGTEADALMAMLGTALQITRAEAGIGKTGFTATDVHAFLADLVDLYAPLAEDRGFALTLAGEDAEPLVIPLNRELVGQAISNLIDNALKYAAGGNRIVLSVSGGREGVEIAVRDNGPGIPPGQRAEAVRRFGRLDPARGMAGSGLGLSLAAAVARLHGGRLELADAAPGLCVRLFLATGS